MDIRSKDVLKQALMAFDGTLIVVSHDRDFLDGLVDKLYEFRDGKVKEHLGGVADFLRKRKLESLAELERKGEVQAVRQGEEEKKTMAQQQFQAQKAVSKEQRKLRNRVNWLEKEIASHEARMAEIEKVLGNPGPQDDIMDLTAEYLNLKRDMDAYTEEWATLSEQLDN